LLLALGLNAALPAPAPAETIDGGRAVIIDGETVAFGSERIRIENIDAPETRGSRCERELVAGLRAKERLAQLLRRGPVQIDRSGEDRYRRTLARLRTAAGDIGEVLVREGLVLPWREGAEAREARLRRWCGATRS
jgi:endonuclease YncB( thermonuclease family)